MPSANDTIKESVVTVEMISWTRQPGRANYVYSFWFRIKTVTYLQQP